MEGKTLQQLKQLCKTMGPSSIGSRLLHTSYATRRKMKSKKNIYCRFIISDLWVFQKASHVISCQLWRHLLLFRDFLMDCSQLYAPLISILIPPGPGSVIGIFFFQDSVICSTPNLEDQKMWCKVTISLALLLVYWAS